MAIGRLRYAECTLPLMRQWAEREGWDFIVLNQRRLFHNPNWPRRRFGLHVEKFQIHELMDQYERVLYMDADILVHPSAPSPFELVPPEAIGGVWDDTGPDAWKREHALARMASSCGAPPFPPRTGPRFLNAGVLVMSAAHRPLWTFDRKAFVRGRWPDQSLFNYRVHAAGVPVHELPETFNLMPLHHDAWDEREVRQSAFLVHYASQPAKRTLFDDLPYFENAWARAAGREPSAEPAVFSSLPQPI
ncbi:MAG: hypothetical protein ACOC3I_05810 [Verrucomicrobiota bacterium]